MDRLDRPGEVGVDLEAIEVADHEERRVLQGLAILEQLLIGGLQVLVLAFILPAEPGLHPDVGPALAAVGFLDALLEGVPGAFGVHFGGFGLVQEFAQVQEVLLTGAALGKVRLSPLGDELLGGHGHCLGR